MEFNLAEKLAIVKAVDKVISADRELHEEEIEYLNQLMRVLDFDMEFVYEARRFNSKQALIILQTMSEQKKSMVAQMMKEMAKADGEIDPEELKVIASIFVKAGIDLGKAGRQGSQFDVSDVYFESSDHIHYEKGQRKSGPFGGARRAIKIESNIELEEAYFVTSYNLEDVTPLWGNNIQMPSKQMKVIESQAAKTILRGFGEDPQAMGDPEGVYSNYGLSIIHPNNEIEKIVLHIYNQDEEIEYLK